MRYGSPLLFLLFVSQLPSPLLYVLYFIVYELSCFHAVDADATTTGQRPVTLNIQPMRPFA